MGFIDLLDTIVSVVIAMILVAVCVYHNYSFIDKL